MTTDPPRDGAAEAPEGRLPAGMRFAIPFNGDPEFPARLGELRHLVDRVFLPIPSAFMATGRPWSLGDPRQYARNLPHLLRELVANGLQPEVLLNSPMPKWTRVDGMLRYLRRMADAGLRHVTVAYLPLAQRVHQELPDLDITASTVAFIHEGARLDRWVQEAGVRRVVPDRTLNKRLEDLRRIRRHGIQVSLVADDGCLPSCPIQFQHYAVYQYRDRRYTQMRETIEHGCRKWRREESWRLYQADIVAGDLPRYAGAADVIKFGRDCRKDTGSLVAQVRHYAQAGSRRNWYAGYVEPPEVFDRLQQCDRFCSDCLWCRDVFLKANQPTDHPDGRAGVLWEPSGADAAAGRPG